MLTPSFDIAFLEQVRVKKIHTFGCPGFSDSRVWDVQRPDGKLGLGSPSTSRSLGCPNSFHARNKYASNAKLSRTSVYFVAPIFSSCFAKSIEPIQAKVWHAARAQPVPAWFFIAVATAGATYHSIIDPMMYAFLRKSFSRHAAVLCEILVMVVRVTRHSHGSRMADQLLAFSVVSATEQLI